MLCVSQNCRQMDEAFKAEGPDDMMDSSSRQAWQNNPTPRAMVDRIIELRRQR